MSELTEEVRRRAGHHCEDMSNASNGIPASVPH
jgi:hypothetical protein